MGWVSDSQSRENDGGCPLNEHVRIVDRQSKLMTELHEQNGHRHNTIV